MVRNDKEKTIAKVSLIEHIRSEINETRKPSALVSLHYQLIVLLHEQRYEIPTNVFRKLVINNVQLVNDEAWEYDEIKIEQLCKALDCYPKGAQGTLLRFMIRELNDGGFESEAKDFKKSHNRWLCGKYYRQRKYIRWLLKLSVSSVFATLVTLGIVFAAASLSTINAPCASWEIMEKTHLTVSENAFINHLINSAYLLIGIEGPTLIALDTAGAILLIFGKIVYLVLVANIVLEAFKNFVRFE